MPVITPDGRPEEHAADDDLHALIQEQQHLRADIERLQEENRQLREKKPDDKKAEDKKPDEKDQKKDDKQDDKKQEDEKPKEPFLVRVRNGVQAHPIRTVILLALVVGLFIGGFFFWRYLQSYVDTDDAEIEGHIHQIGSRVSGTVVAVYTENNRSVVPGQTLVDLDPRDYETALKQAEANLKQVEAAVDAEAPNVPITQTSQSTAVSTARLDVANAQAALQEAEHAYQSALADVGQAEASAANAQREEERYRVLVQKDEVSREVYDQKVTQAQAQAQLVSSRKATADAAHRVIDQRQAVVNEAQEREQETESNRPRQEAAQRATLETRRANVQAARAQVEAARLNLSYTKIAAPAGGIIGDKTVEVGQQVAPGQELFAITGLQDLWVTANFKETQIKQMHPGQRVTMYVDALDLKFEGYVENMPGATGAEYSLLPPENATGNYIKVVQRLPLRLRFKPNQTGEDRLRPGMSVEPKVWVE